MSVSGFTQKTSSSVSSTSPATSSSHQPPTKALKAFEDAHSDHSSSKPLVESTDDELTENVVQAVPNVPKEGEEQGGEEEHDADAFVPSPDRQSTLEVPLVDLTPEQVKPEVFEIGADDNEEKQEDDKGRLEAAAATESGPLLADQPLVQTCSVGSAAVRASSVPSRSLNDPEGFCTLFKTKNLKNQQNI